MREEIKNHKITFLPRRKLSLGIVCRTLSARHIFRFRTLSLFQLVLAVDNFYSNNRVKIKTLSLSFCLKKVNLSAYFLCNQIHISSVITLINPIVCQMISFKRIHIAFILA